MNSESKYFSEKLLFRIFYFISITVILGYFLISYINEKSARSTTLEWSRLAYWPECAKKERAATSGSMFTREFEYSFKCPLQEVEQWLDESSGIKDAEIDKQGQLTIYKIKPGGGAQFAELRVHSKTGSVNLRVYWS